jgi:hypothetical protein
MPVLFDYSHVVILAILGAASMTHDSREPATLRLSGEPTRIAQPAVFYAFSPTVVRSAGADSNLTFSIENKPAWASFGRRHGTLYGVPHAKDAGTYRDIRITATDGNIVADLQAFTLEVPVGSARQ